MNYKDLCNPAKIWFALSIISAIFMLYNGVNTFMVVVRLFAAFIWTIFIGLLCRNNMYTLSWSLVILPIFYMYFM